MQNEQKLPQQESQLRHLPHNQRVACFKFDKFTLSLHLFALQSHFMLQFGEI